MRKVLTLCAFVALFSAVQAGGYRVALQGVRQAAMAHTSAHTRDASVMFYNPAGISFIDSKLSVAAGAFALFPETEYQNYIMNYSAKTEKTMGTPAYFAASYRAFKDVTLGLSVTTPFGNNLKWDDNWAGAPLVQEIDLKAFFIQPTIAVKFSDWFSAGFGFIHARGSVYLKKEITNLNGGLELEDTDASGNGFNVGAYFRATDKLDISLAYRSPIDMDAIDGDATFNVSPNLVSSTGSIRTLNDKFSATLPLVSEFTVGASYKFSPKFLLAADVNFAGWQKYRNLTFDFEQNQVGNQSSDATISVTPKNFKQSNVYRIGGEYMIKDNFALRLGYYYDDSPVKDEYWSPETPSTNNHAITGGLGYKWKNFNFDLFGAYLRGEVRDVNNSNAGFYGQVRTTGMYFGFGLSYNAF